MKKTQNSSLVFTKINNKRYSLLLDYNAYFNIISFLFLLVGSTITAQQKTNDSIITTTKYREDQIYIGVNYNILNNLPEGVVQNNISYGFQTGVIRDIPVNKKGTTAIGIGVGYAYDRYTSNFSVNKPNDNILYSIFVNSDSSDKNNFDFHKIDFPFELRFRTSTPTNQVFWRIYLGFVYSVVFSNQISIIENPNLFNHQQYNFRNTQQAIYLNFNFKTRWNIRISYQLSNLFKNNTSFENPNTLDVTSLHVNPIQIGLRMYFL